MANITDGTSSTIMAVEVDEDSAVVWTKPDDWKVDEKDPTKGLRVYPDSGLLVAMMDASVRFLPAKIDPKTLWALITADGNEAVQLP